MLLEARLYDATNDTEKKELWSLSNELVNQNKAIVREFKVSQLRN